MKRIYHLVLVALLGMSYTSCTSGSIYGEAPAIAPKCGEDSITIVIEIDDTKDEWGNCKASPYTKFYEEWNIKDGWDNGMERVYDAWITLQHEYFVSTIRCDNADKHKFTYIVHQVGDRETLMKYFNHEKGYGAAKGMIFDINDAIN